MQWQPRSISRVVRGTLVSSIGVDSNAHIDAAAPRSLTRLDLKTGEAGTGRQIASGFYSHQLSESNVNQGVRAGEARRLTTRDMFGALAL